MSTGSGFWKPASSASWDHGHRHPQAPSHFASHDENEGIPAAALSHRGASLAQQRLLLPIAKHKKQILYAVEQYGVTVIVGETGSGKSTQIPQYLVETGGWADNDFTVLCTQPRRIAAIALAERVATEAGTTLGDRVGYAVRFDEKTSARTQIKYVTDGMLLREATLGDPLLSKYSVVMVDEAHERTLNSDAVLGLLKKIRRKRNGLRVIVCSATIDAQAFLEFFVGKGQTDKDPSGKPVASKSEKDNNTASTAIDQGTIISVDGRQYPVDVLFLEKAAPDYLRCTVETAMLIHQVEQGGDILCFLPTAEDIDRAIALAEERYEDQRGKVDLLPLYGTLPFHMQARIFQTDGRSKRRRLIFATNIAETSVTVPNITHVVDSGLVKLPYFDPKTALQRMIVGPVSRASARQRAGRAGRVQAGKCYRLYTEAYLLNQMKPQTAPEMLRTNLSSFVLTLKALGVDNILSFDLMDVPNVDALSHALESLFALGAMDDRTNLTDLGWSMSAFPTDPSVSRMLLESLTVKCSWEVLAVAAAMQVRDLWVRPRGRRQQQLIDYNQALSEVADSSGDHVTFCNILVEMDERSLSQDDCKERFLNYVAIKRAMEVRSQLAKFLRKFGRIQPVALGRQDSRSMAIRRCVTAGFFLNVAKLHNDGRYYTLRKKIMVTPSNTSVYSSHAQMSSEYIVFGESLDGPRGGIEIKSVSAIEAKWLRELAPHYWE